MIPGHMSVVGDHSMSKVLRKQEIKGRQWDGFLIFDCVSKSQNLGMLGPGPGRTYVSQVYNVDKHMKSIMACIKQESRGTNGAGFLFLVVTHGNLKIWACLFKSENLGVRGPGPGRTYVFQV